MNRRSQSRFGSAGRATLFGAAALVLVPASSFAQSLGGFGRQQGNSTRSAQPQYVPQQAPQQSAPEPQPQYRQEPTPFPVYNPAPVRNPEPVRVPEPVQQQAPIRQLEPSQPRLPIRQFEPVQSPAPVRLGTGTQTSVSENGGVVWQNPRANRPNTGGNFPRRMGQQNDGQQGNRSGDNNDGISPFFRGHVSPHSNYPSDGISPFFRGSTGAGPVRNGSVNGNYRSSNSYDPIRITTPVGQRELPYHRNPDYIYNSGSSVFIGNGPTFLGGYYYGNYCDSGNYQYSYPSVYSVYSGFPQYIYSPTIVVLSQPYFPVYVSDWLPYSQPTYQVTYNETNYYVGSEQRVDQLKEGGKSAREALKYAYPEGSFQAAFADIAKAWSTNDYDLIKRHIKSDDSKITVALNKKYGYSLNASDYRSITKDAVEKLNTRTFVFSRLRKAKNGDVTAFGRHTYSLSSGNDFNTISSDSGTVPFDQADQPDPYNTSPDSSSDSVKTVYVSYTLRHRGNEWFIVSVDSSKDSLVDKN